MFVQQPALPVLLGVTINKGPVLLGHGAMVASLAQSSLQTTARSEVGMLMAALQTIAGLLETGDGMPLCSCC